jgi:hypothetical protein
MVIFFIFLKNLYGLIGAGFYIANTAKALHR